MKVYAKKLISESGNVIAKKSCLMVWVKKNNKNLKKILMSSAAPRGPKFPKIVFFFIKINFFHNLFVYSQIIA